MLETKADTSKVAIIGAGNVGSTFAFALMRSGVAREIAIIDINKELAEGECMDLNHGASFVPPVEVYSADYDACEGADVVVVTAGAKQKPGQSRIDLVQKNVEIFENIIPKIVEHTEDAVILVVTNPVDILTYVTLNISGLPKNQVMGSGTVLDSSRFRYLISDHCKVDARNVHAYIIGEHGDSELPVWSHANIGGMILDEYCQMCPQGCRYEENLRNIFTEVKNAAYKIIDSKGATYWAISLACVRIVEAILRDENSVLPVSTLIEDYQGVNDVCLSIPSIVNRQGVRRFLPLELSEEERKKFKESGDKLKNIIKEVGYD